MRDAAEGKKLLAELRHRAAAEVASFMLSPPGGVACAWLAGAVPFALTFLHERGSISFLACVIADIATLVTVFVLLNSWGSIHVYPDLLVIRQPWRTRRLTYAAITHIRLRRGTTVEIMVDSQSYVLNLSGLAPFARLRAIVLERRVTDLISSAARRREYPHLRAGLRSAANWIAEARSASVDHYREAPAFHDEMLAILEDATVAEEERVGALLRIPRPLDPGVAERLRAIQRSTGLDDLRRVIDAVLNQAAEGIIEVAVSAFTRGSSAPPKTRTGPHLKDSERSGVRIAVDTGASHAAGITVDDDEHDRELTAEEEARPPTIERGRKLEKPS